MRGEVPGKVAAVIALQTVQIYFDLISLRNGYILTIAVLTALLITNPVLGLN